MGNNVIEFGLYFQADSVKAEADIRSIGTTTKATADQVQAAGQTMAAALEVSAAAVTKTAAATVALGESEEAATARIRAMVAASLEQNTVVVESTRLADQAATSTQRSTAENIAYAASLERITAQMWQQPKGATSAGSAGNVATEESQKFVASLQRQYDMLGKNSAELAAYEVRLLGGTRETQAQARALAEKSDVLREQMALEQRNAQAGDNFIARLKEQTATIGMNRTELLAHKAAQLGVSQEAAPMIAALDGATKSTHQFSFGTAQSKKELLVLAHELSQGQFQRFGGSMMVLGEQTGAAALLFSGAGLAALSLAAAIGTVVYAMFKGAATQREMNNALITTNYYAGVTSDGLNDLAHAAVATGGSIGKAQQTVTELASKGKFSADQIGYITSAVVALEHATGTSIHKTIAEFETLAVQSTGSTARATEVITRATIKLDDQYHFLTEAVYEQIRALEKEGNAKAASALATEEFAKATEDGARKIEANLGTIATGWKAITDGIGNAIDKMSEWGKKATPASTVKKLTLEIEQIDNGSYSSAHGGGERNAYDKKTLDTIRVGLVKELATAQAALNVANKEAADARATALTQSNGVHAAFMVQSEDIKLQKRGMSELAISLQQYAENIEKIKAANPNSPLVTAEAVAEGIAARTKAHSQKETKPHADRAENTALADRLARIQDDVAAEKTTYDLLAKIDDLYHQAGKLGDEKFYQNRRDYAEAATKDQISAYNAQIRALQSYQNMTKEEAAKHAKQINDITAKRNAADIQGQNALTVLDMQWMLSKEAIVAASDDASSKYLSGLAAEAAAQEQANIVHGKSKALIEDEIIARNKLAITALQENLVDQRRRGDKEDDIAQTEKLIKALQDENALRGRKATAIATGDAMKFDDKMWKDGESAAKAMASSMADSFGTVGTAIGKMSAALIDYQTVQRNIQKDLENEKSLASGPNAALKIAEAEQRATQASAKAQIKQYADVSGAAAGFFNKSSAGYKVLHSAEQAFRAYEMAMALESMVKKVFFKETEVAANLTLNGTKIAGEATATAASTGLAATEASAWGITAVVKALASLPFPMNLAAGAATLAAVVAIGASMIGGMGGGASQASQPAAGTGSVLGDPSAKSESISRSLAILEKNSGLGLAHTVSMDRSLRQIVSGIGNVGNLLARSGVTGPGGGAAAGVQTGSTPLGGAVGQLAFSGLGAYGGALLGGSIAGAMTMGVIGSTTTTMMGAIAGPLGLAVGAVLGSVLGSVASKLFGSSKSITAQGITANPTSLGQIDAVGFTAQSYAEVQTKKKALGVTYSNKTNTQTEDLSKELNAQFSMIILSMGQTVRGAAHVLGMDGDAFNARMNAFVVDLGKIPLKDLSAADQQKALEAAFSKMGDDMARWGVAGLDKYQHIGEGYLETLARVTNDYLQVSDVLAVLGKSINVTGISAVKLSEDLIDAAGGLDKLTSGTAYFYQNFLTEAERMAPITKSVTSAMDALGFGGVKTMDQFKQLVLQTADGVASGKSGANELYAKLLALAEPFKQAADYAAELAAATGNYVAVAKTATEIANERRDLQQQLNELTKTDTELLAIQRAAISDVNKALFDQVQAAKAVVTAKDALSKAYETESAAAQTALEKTKSWVTTLNSLTASTALGNLSTLTPEQKYAEARAQFERTLAAANAGDATAQSGLAAAEQAFLNASQVVNASDAKYAADYARVQAANIDAMKWAKAQVDVQQASLDALKSQVSGLIKINDSVLTVAQAIKNLQDAMGGATAIGVKINGSHANGLSRVPFDGYVAELHEGERVLTSFEAANYSARSNIGADAVVAEIRGLREDNRRLNATVERLVDGQAEKTGAIVSATYDASARNAKTVVAGVDKSAKASAWSNRTKTEYA